MSSLLKTCKKFIKKIVPRQSIQLLERIKNKIVNAIYPIKLRLIHYNYKRLVTKIRKKDRIKVAFFVIHHTAWKYGGLYRLMERDDKFEPVVIICPFVVFGEKTLRDTMISGYNEFKSKGYHVLKTLDFETGRWLDIKKDVNPDIICFTNPWKITKKEYQINNFLFRLSCYVPYGYETSTLYNAYYNSDMHNFVWKFFIENNFHQELAKQYSRNKGKNSIVSGYPGLDIFKITGAEPKDVWKIKDRKVKRIIWAVHHTIPGFGGNLDYSTFLNFYDSMLNIAISFKDQIQIAFKPHPILKENLSKEHLWGKAKTDEYYRKWSEMENTLLAEGDYLDLFFTSDAMIHDCGSFLIEYLFTNKPVMYLWSDDAIPERFNKIGKLALNQLYRGNNEKDIVEFIQQVVISGNDTKQKERDDFFYSEIMMDTDIVASKTIYNHIKSEVIH